MCRHRIHREERVENCGRAMKAGVTAVDLLQKLSQLTE